MVDSRLVLLWGITLLLFLGHTNADGHEKEGCRKKMNDKDRMEGPPKFWLNAEVETKTGKIVLELMQGISDDGSAGETLAMLTVDGEPMMLDNETEIGIVEEAMNCSLVQKENITDLTSLFYKSWRDNGNESALEAMKESSMGEGEDEEESAWKMLEESVPAFDLWGSMVVLTSADKDNVCGILKPMETNVIKFRFPKNVEFEKCKLVDVLSMRFGLPRNAIVTSNPMMAEGDDCAEVGVSLVADLEPGHLRMIYKSLSEGYELGPFSPTDKCWTDLKESPIALKIVKMFLEQDDEKDKRDDEKDKMNDKPADCRNLRLSSEYMQRLRMYDATMKAYAMKYEIDVPQIGEGGGEYKPRDGGCSKEGQTSKQEQDFLTLAKFIGMPESESMDGTAEDLSALLSSSNMDKIKSVLDGMKEAQRNEEETIRRTYYGLCMIANAGENKAEYLRGIKTRFDAAMDWGDEGDMILRELIVKDIMRILQNSTLGGLKKRVTSHSKFPMQTLQKKLQYILGMSGGCSDESERRRVMQKIKELPHLVQSVVKAIGNEKLIHFIDEKVGNDTKMMGKELFLFVYSPDPMPEEGFLDKLVNLSDVSESEFMDVLENVTRMVQHADNDQLMALHTFLLSESELEAGCPFGELVAELGLTSGGCDSDADAWGRGTGGDRRDEFMNRGDGGFRGQSGNGRRGDAEWNPSSGPRRAQEYGGYWSDEMQYGGAYQQGGLRGRAIGGDGNYQGNRNRRRNNGAGGSNDWWPSDGDGYMGEPQGYGYGY